MTCIIGLVEDGKVYIGGDSAGVSGFNISHRKDEKVFKNGNMIFGYTSSFRMGQILRFSLKIPDHDPRTDDYEYMCSTFIDACIDCLKLKGYATVNNGEVSGGTFLVGYKGNLYSIDSDFQVGKQLGNFDSCGCGVNYAKGAMSVLNTTVLEPEDKIKEALKIVEHWSAGVSAPFNIVSI